MKEHQELTVQNLAPYSVCEEITFWVDEGGVNIKGNRGTHYTIAHEDWERLTGKIWHLRGKIVNNERLVKTG